MLANYVANTSIKDDEQINHGITTFSHERIEIKTELSNVGTNDTIDRVNDNMVAKPNNTAITSSGVVYVEELYDKPLLQFDPKLELQIKVKFL